MKKIFIIWHGGCKNKGCEALLVGILSLLPKMFPKEKVEVKCTTTLLDYDKNLFKDITFVKMVPLAGDLRLSLLNFFEKVPFINSIIKYLLNFSHNDVINNYFFHKEKLIESIKESDYLFGIGGDMLSETYGSCNLYTLLEYIKLAKKYNKKIYLIGQSIGPFKKKNLRKMQKYLSEVDWITVREPVSYNYLKNNNFKMSNVELTADLAFNFNIKDYLPSPKIFKNLLEGRSNLKIGINVSEGISRYSNTNKKKYFKIMVKLICYLIKRYSQSKVYLIPHNFFPEDDDRKICNKIAFNLKNKRVIPICDLEADLSSKDIKYFISKMDVFIGARTHSTIAAWTTYVPTLAIAYSLKAYGLVEFIFGKTKSKDFIIDIKDLNYNTLKIKVDNLIMNRKKIKSYLKSYIKKFKKRSLNNIIHVKN